MRDKPLMVESRQMFIETVNRIYERMDAEGWTAHALSIEIGRNRHYVRDLKRAIEDPKVTGYPKHETLQKIADKLRTSVGYLRGEHDDPTISDTPAAGVVPRVDRPRRRNLRSTATKASLPDLGEMTVPIIKATGTSKGGFRMSEDKIGYGPRPPSIANDPDAYIVRILDDTLWPAFEIDDPAYVVPTRPWAVGNYVLVTVGEDSVIRRIAKMDAQTLWLQQHKPDRTVRLSRAEISRIERVLRYPELMRPS